MNSLILALQNQIDAHVDAFIDKIVAEFEIDKDALTQMWVETRGESVKAKKGKKGTSRKGKTGYQVFANMHRAQVNAKYPELSGKEKFGKVASDLGTMWKALSDEQKEAYKVKAIEENGSGEEKEVNTCVFILTAGKNKDKQCSLKAMEGSDMCKRHAEKVARDDAASESAGSSSGEGKVTCAFILTAGKNKGKQCSLKPMKGGDMCKKHTEKVNATAEMAKIIQESKAIKAESSKVEVEERIEKALGVEVDDEEDEEDEEEVDTEEDLVLERIENKTQKCNHVLARGPRHGKTCDNPKTTKCFIGYDTNSEGDKVKIFAYKCSLHAVKKIN